jgi:hypothetical protein
MSTKGITDCGREGTDLHRPGSRLWDREGNVFGLTTGGRRQCTLEGCGGTWVGVRWPDGGLTWPCLKGVALDRDGRWRIQ